MSVSLDRLSVPVMTAFLLGKEILRSPSQESDVDLAMESGTLDSSSSSSGMYRNTSYLIS